MAAESRRSATPRRLRVVVTSPDSARPDSRGLGTWLERAAPARARGEVTVALISDGRMRTLNRAFRGKDYATDVLSFPVVPGPQSTVQGNDAASLGDIVIAKGVARRQARDAGHSLGTELRVLALHGLLHLLGYDHERDHGEMKRAEARLRRAAGLTEGLIERRRRGPARSRKRR